MTDPRVTLVPPARRTRRWVRANAAIDPASATTASASQGQYRWANVVVDWASMERPAMAKAATPPPMATMTPAARRPRWSPSPVGALSTTVVIHDHHPNRADGGTTSPPRRSRRFFPSTRLRCWVGGDHQLTDTGDQ